MKPPAYVITPKGAVMIAIVFVFMLVFNYLVS